MIQFRKSKKIGPFRLTATTRGLSLSGGAPGARVSINTKGEVRRTLGVPGAGVYDVKKMGTVGQPTSPNDYSGDKAGSQPAVFQVPMQGGLVEIPEGVTSIYIEPFTSRSRVSRVWVVSTIILATILFLTLVTR